ncbi:hypothetical protein PACILC2_55290 [Paenibacillus cisolokensis]|uniref:AI-2E family transporter n=1 Tax=Paenibacillus cisolokensis TaxID=1658519 RepID=A0ABQ4NGE1_9BACL|nr:hypothetical protein PACILC2_55290 [Paenibacillus cisolokensis]
MNRQREWTDRFRIFLNNKFVLFLLVLLLIGLNVLVFSKVPHIFEPLRVLAKTVLLPIILTGIVYYLTNPLVDYLERRKSSAPTPYWRCIWRLSASSR